MRPLLLITLWLIPCALFSGTHEEYLKARTLVTRTVKQLAPPADATFELHQTLRWLAHLRRPWNTWRRQIDGRFVLADNGAAFYQEDSTTSMGRLYWHYTYACDTTLAIVHSSSEKPERLTLSDKAEFLYDVTSLTPVMLLRDFLARNDEAGLVRFVDGAVDSVVYRVEKGTVVTIAIDPKKLEVRSISTLFAHDMYGDVLRTWSFEDYRRSETSAFVYPSKVTSRQQGFDASVATIEASSQPFDKAYVHGLIPSTYHLEPDPIPSTPEVIRTDYNAHIHLLDLKHTTSRVVVVEFREYLAVIGAPLNSENGELILQKAREIAPAKPVRYFTFGHHHPHYLGGVRSFIHAGATVLSVPMDTTYLGQLASFPHTFHPDSLQLDPRPLQLEVFEKEKTLSDGEMEMQIIRIDTNSHHADDFLIYYFPQYRLLYQDELIWIEKDKPIAPASEGEKGLYNAIVEHGFAVDTIIQGWPVRDNGSYKTIITFDELRQSMVAAPSKQP